MAKTKPIVALIYDFDGTLSPGNMQEYAFIKATDMSVKDFWTENTEKAKSQDADQILTYMFLMLQKAKGKGISLKKSQFKEFGKSVELFNGVEDWFDRINEFGKSKDVVVEHFINSSGLKEMIEGTKIAKKFKKIFACSYLYNVDGIAEWPAVSVNFTNKTQFLFKINKGIDSVYESKKINDFIPESERRVPFSNMVYFGDGETDIPCMKLVKEQGGHSIAVYQPGKIDKKKRASKLINENRVNFVCQADYSEDKEIDKVVKTIIGKIKADSDFNDLLRKHVKIAKIKKTTP
ncbi:MAG: phosphoserine phosphatase [Porphyromonadaceae bacterium CG2_30_38_12]|nr:MAG: phosphoserine phosphatase [Porphyromonadaceae bacterium CG2_30_38_12]